MPLNIPQIEALKKISTHLYEAMNRIVSGVNNLKLSMDTDVTDGTDFARVSAAALTSNDVDPTRPGVLMKGSVPPTWNGSFTYASTTSSITWSWSGLVIYRADGTTTAVANGSLAIASLSPGTTYYFYPYWDDTLLALAWVAGGAGWPAAAGNPPNAFTSKTIAAAQQQSLQGRIPLSAGAMIAATTTSGTGGGSGGGSGSCVRAGMMVLSRDRDTIAIENVRVGEHILGHDGFLNERWTRVVRHEVHPADAFVRLTFSNEDSLDVTPHHVFTLADGAPVRAERLCLGDILVGRLGRLTLKKIELVAEEGAKVIVACEPSHEFFAGRAAASVLTHNYNFSS
ncbi:MAG TPA: Hint domain-containing protein [Candidatus Acidoferrales bacterium]|nr:Hint domain-containing protein [Candidatus Acidoferrales bacterium]